MITQIFHQGKNEIKILTAETLEDANKNNFPEGQFSKYYINGKQVLTYMDMVKFIKDEAYKENTALVSDKKQLLKVRNQMMKTQKDEVKRILNELKVKYKSIGIKESDLFDINNIISKIDENGMRVKE